MKNGANAEHNFDLIQRFKAFELSEDELKAFDEKLSKDAKLRLELERYQQVESYIDNKLGRSDTQNTMSVHFKSLFKENKPLVINRLWLSVAAVLSGCCIAVYVISSFLFSPSVNEISDNYIKNTNKVLFSNTKAPGTKMTPSEAILIQSSALLTKDSLTSALNLLNTIPDTDSLFLAAVLLKGQIAMERQEWNTAISLFQFILESPSPSYNDIALWNQALAYVKINAIPQAKNNLSIIIQERYPQAEKAKQLLDKIKNDI